MWVSHQASQSWVPNEHIQFYACVCIESQPASYVHFTCANSNIHLQETSKNNSIMQAILPTIPLTEYRCASYPQDMEPMDMGGCLYR